MYNKVKYTCKNCGWETFIRAEWSDLKPKRCMNKKCNTSFLKNTKDLIITPPNKKEKPSPQKEQKNEKGQTNSKAKTSRKSFKQQDEDKKQEEIQENSK